MRCSNCGREIAEGSLVCKRCGVKIEGVKEVRGAKRVNKIKEVTEVVKEKTTTVGRDTIRTYVTPRIIPPDMLDDGETLIIEERPHFIYTFYRPLLVLLITIVIGVFSREFFVGVVLVFPALVYLFLIWLVWRFTNYALTTNRVIRITGIIAKDMYENTIERIQDIRMKMGIIQRILGCGDIMITTAGTSGIECLWKNIKNPSHVQKMIRSLLRK